MGILIITVKNTKARSGATDETTDEATDGVGVNNHKEALKLITFMLYYAYYNTFEEPLNEHLYQQILNVQSEKSSKSFAVTLGEMLKVMNKQSESIAEDSTLTQTHDEVTKREKTSHVIAELSRMMAEELEGDLFEGLNRGEIKKASTHLQTRAIQEVRKGKEAIASSSKTALIETNNYYEEKSELYRLLNREKYMYVILALKTISTYVEGHNNNLVYKLTLKHEDKSLRPKLYEDLDEEQQRAAALAEVELMIHTKALEAWESKDMFYRKDTRSFDKIKAEVRERLEVEWAALEKTEQQIGQELLEHKKDTKPDKDSYILDALDHGKSFLDTVGADIKFFANQGKKLEYLSDNHPLLKANTNLTYYDKYRVNYRSDKYDMDKDGWKNADYMWKQAIENLQYALTSIQSYAELKDLPESQSIRQIDYARRVLDIANDAKKLADENKRKVDAYMDFNSKIATTVISAAISAATVPDISIKGGGYVGGADDSDDDSDEQADDSDDDSDEQAGAWNAWGDLTVEPARADVKAAARVKSPAFSMAEVKEAGWAEAAKVPGVVGAAAAAAARVVRRGVKKVADTVMAETVGAPPLLWRGREMDMKPTETNDAKEWMLKVNIDKADSDVASRNTKDINDVMFIVNKVNEATSEQTTAKTELDRAKDKLDNIEADTKVMNLKSKLTNATDIYNSEFKTLETATTAEQTALTDLKEALKKNNDKGGTAKLRLNSAVAVKNAATDKVIKAKRDVTEAEKALNNAMLTVKTEFNIAQQNLNDKNRELDKANKVMKTLTMADANTKVEKATEILKEAHAKFYATGTEPLEPADKEQPVIEHTLQVAKLVRDFDKYMGYNPLITINNVSRIKRVVIDMSNIIQNWILDYKPYTTQDDISKYQTELDREKKYKTYSKDESADVIKAKTGRYEEYKSILERDKNRNYLMLRYINNVIAKIKDTTANNRETGRKSTPPLYELEAAIDDAKAMEEDVKAAREIDIRNVNIWNVRVNVEEKARAEEAAKTKAGAKLEEVTTAQAAFDAAKDRMNSSLEDEKAAAVVDSLFTRITKLFSIPSSLSMSNSEKKATTAINRIIESYTQRLNAQRELIKALKNYNSDNSETNSNALIKRLNNIGKSLKEMYAAQDHFYKVDTFKSNRPPPLVTIMITQYVIDVIEEYKLLLTRTISSKNMMKLIKIFGDILKPMIISMIRRSVTSAFDIQYEDIQSMLKKNLHHVVKDGLTIISMPDKTITDRLTRMAKIALKRWEESSDEVTAATVVAALVAATAADEPGTTAPVAEYTGTKRCFECEHIVSPILMSMGAVSVEAMVTAADNAAHEKPMGTSLSVTGLATIAVGSVVAAAGAGTAAAAAAALASSLIVFGGLVTLHPGIKKWHDENKDKAIDFLSQQLAAHGLLNASYGVDAVITDDTATEDTVATEDTSVAVVVAAAAAAASTPMLSPKAAVSKPPKPHPMPSLS